MNKLWLSLSIVTLVLAALSGCASKGKEDSSDGESGTPLSAIDDTQTYDSAVADNGFRVAGTFTSVGTALEGGENGSAVSLKANDLAADDTGGAVDLADFLIDAKEADGNRLQAEIRSMTTAAAAGATGDYLGGVGHGVDVGGDSGFFSSDLPTTKAYILLHGMARVRYNNETIDGLQLVEVAVTKGVRGADGAVLPEAEDDLEVHVLFPGSLISGHAGFPGVSDGFVYYYFENVKLEQLTPEAKGTVGGRLQAPAEPNVPPTAAFSVMFGGAAVTSAEFDPDTKYLNVTLDASNSTDSDGTIEAFSWSVQEYNATGALVDLNKTSGQMANFSFETGGAKFIQLRIIDNDGGIANVTQSFYVNTLKTYGFTFGAGDTPLDAAGADPTKCQIALNCKDHQLTIMYGATSLTTSAISSGTQCNSPNQDLYAPGTDRNSGDPVASGNGITVAADKLAAVGKYTIDVWFDAQVKCAYSFTALVSYAPAEAATP